ncbi:MAG: SDR family oxidoreductase, partial [Verrucomicrobia bacterium]|nr:SDR family oxidoreductase [Verrucomicrobiota bacterium]
LVTFTVSLAREVAKHGIYVNGVAPGFMDTDMAREAIEARREQTLARIPLGRIAAPSEIADVVVFLASARASYTTGATFDATGGMLMR